MGKNKDINEVWETLKDTRSPDEIEFDKLLIEVYEGAVRNHKKLQAAEAAKQVPKVKPKQNNDLKR